MPTVVLLHHANQLLITDGYADRDGITPVAEAVLAVAQLHEQCRLVGSLHLSGTLVEALAWHRPDVLERVRGLTASRLLEAVGGAYGEPVLTQLTARAVRRHLRVTSEVMGRHLDTPHPTSAWVPERVWSPHLGPLLAQAGYQRVALDDRLLLPAGARPGHDRVGPWHQRPRQLDPRLCQVVREDAGGLLVAPITAALRYLVPPRGEQDLELLDRLVATLPDDAVLVYADDLERTAGVAGWEAALDRFTMFMAWLSTHPRLRAARLDDLSAPAAPAVPVQAGTYYELAHQHGAGDDYSGWSQDPRWLPYAAVLSAVEDELDRSDRGRHIDALAERLLLVGQHETGWQDMTATGRAPAPWAQATAAHARDARPVMHIGRWAAGGGCEPSSTLVDIDDDGHSEVVLADASLWCAVSPRFGARATLAAVRDGFDARVIVGNPLDHWNFQQESHRFMQEPPGHPGGLGAHGEEDEPWQVELPEAGAGVARVVLRRAEETRRLALLDGTLALCWQGQGEVTMESLISPDYLSALYEGSARTHALTGPGFAAVQADGRTTWLGWGAGGTPVGPRHLAAGHGATFAVRAEGHLHLLIGTGPVDGAVVTERLAQAAGPLHAGELVGPLRGRSTAA